MSEARKIATEHEVHTHGDIEHTTPPLKGSYKAYSEFRLCWDAGACFLKIKRIKGNHGVRYGLRIDVAFTNDYFHLTHKVACEVKGTIRGLFFHYFIYEPEREAVQP